MSDALAGSLLTAGGVLIAAVLTAVIWMLQEIKTLKSAIVVTIFAVGIILLMDPLVLAPLRAIDPAPANMDGIPTVLFEQKVQQAHAIIEGWNTGIGYAMSILIFTAIYKLADVTALANRAVRSLLIRPYKANKVVPEPDALKRIGDKADFLGGLINLLICAVMFYYVTSRLK